MTSRRSFLRQLSAASVTPILAKAAKKASSNTDYWKEISALFEKDVFGRLNLNTGSAGIMPIPILENFIHNTKLINNFAPYYTKQKQSESIDEIMTRLAKYVGVKSNESIALTRNTTQGINHILYGVPFEKGDEVVLSSLAYPYPNYILDRLSESAGIRKVVVPLSPLENDNVIIERFADAITPRTKLLLLTHITHRWGRVMPVKSIIKLAKSKGVQVLIDGAHAVGQIDFAIDDLDPDYYVTSLHKWSYAPLGTGMLYIHPSRLKELKPPTCYPENASGSMAMFTHEGTIPFQNILTLDAVLDFNEDIGIRNKEARLHKLSSYTIEELSKIPNIEVFQEQPDIKGIFGMRMRADKQKNIIKLYDDYKINLKTVNLNRQSSFRISMNLHLDYPDIDRFLEVTEKIAKS